MRMKRVRLHPSSRSFSMEFWASAVAFSTFIITTTFLSRATGGFTTSTLTERIRFIPMVARVS